MSNAESYYIHHAAVIMGTMSGRGIDMSEAFSAGLGMALGLVMGQYVLQATRPLDVVVKRVLICQKCDAQNSVENKFCGNCGQSLYPPPLIACQKCGSKMPVTMKFCGDCGSALRK